MNDELSMAVAFGYALMPSPFMTERGQVRFPKSKSKRIRKKWSKRHANFGDVPQWKLFVLHPKRAVIDHPLVIKRLQRAILKKEKL